MGCRHGDAGMGLQAWGCRRGDVGMGMQTWGYRHGVAGMGIQAWGCRHGDADMGMQLWGCRHGDAVRPGLNWPSPWRGTAVETLGSSLHLFCLLPGIPSPSMLARLCGCPALVWAVTLVRLSGCSFQHSQEKVYSDSLISGSYNLSASLLQ